MNANERRIFNKLKQRIYSTTREFYTQSGEKLTMEERLLIDYFAGIFTADLMNALKGANKNDKRSDT